ncbi:nuclear transport factor 2 family protein [Herbaspirillum sp. NPDC087042]|uniref:nuclear transport factor 2 family protein n=1 Tax=Herbaspirillum sp. NPDC087042 TaxID=3364004 RepID=UPI0037F8336A
MDKSGITRREALVALGTGIAAAGMSSSASAADNSSLEAASEALRRALQEGDGKVLTALLHDHMTYSHSDGRVWTKEVLLSTVAGKQRYLSVATSEQTVDVVGEVGIVRHIYDVVNNDEKKSRSHLKVLLCWVRQGQGWQLLARSGTGIPA